MKWPSPPLRLVDIFSVHCRNLAEIFFGNAFSPLQRKKIGGSPLLSLFFFANFDPLLGQSIFYVVMDVDVRPVSCLFWARMALRWKDLFGFRMCTKRATKVFFFFLTLLFDRFLLFFSLIISNGTNAFGSVDVGG